MWRDVKQRCDWRRRKKSAAPDGGFGDAQN